MHNGPDTTKICEASPLLVSRSLKRTLANKTYDAAKIVLQMNEKSGEADTTRDAWCDENGPVIMRPFAQ